MGTQQLLLIVLGVIIVGIAVVVGINIFGTNADNANKDAVTQDCLRLAAAAQGFYRKPALLGGGGNSFNGVDLADLGMDATGVNINGTYTVTPADQTCDIVGTSATVNAATVTITVNPGSIDDPVFAGW
ncbi:MAG: hypothetical protein IPP94_14325 [Ignavibacteria bacterium]|jgi:hypothetical protein|nr:hypothetical protein [Ignavibacteria bacterium]